MSERTEATRHVLKALEAYQLIERFEVHEEEQMVTFTLDRHHCDAHITVDLTTGIFEDNLEGD